jgi:hypothetical protein
MFALTALAFVLSVGAAPISNYSLAPINARDTCTPGTVVCNGTNQFALCNAPQPLIWEAVNVGSVCSNGAIVASSAVAGTGTGSAYGSGTAPIAPVSTYTASTATVTAPSNPSSTETSTMSPPTSDTASSVSTRSTTVDSPATYSGPSITGSQPATSAASSESMPSATGSYKSYSGDGSSAAGWPSISEFLSFEQLWDMNVPVMKESCSAFDQPNDSDDEIAAIKSAIIDNSPKAGIDPRFALAIMMQESKGCVRVWTTFYSHNNPGLFQSAGTGTCNGNVFVDGELKTPGPVSTPCTTGQIDTMVSDGLLGTGDGSYALGPLLKTTGKGPTAQGYYETARMYNSGSVPPNGDLSGPGATASYASDVANRLLGTLTSQQSPFSGS